MNQSHAKAYVASEGDCCTTGITQGTGKITVVDLRTNQVLTTIDPRPPSETPPEFPIPPSDAHEFALANDEVHGKVYVASSASIGVIDVASDRFTLLQDRTFEGELGGAGWAVDTVRNVAYIPFYGDNRLLTVDGASGQIGSVSLSASRGRGPLDLEISERENKLYVAMLHQPSKPSPAILVLDRDIGRFKFVGNDDLQPLVFNKRTNRLFSGVQVGERGAIVNGQTDQFRSVNFGGEGIGAAAVRGKSDNAYFANDHSVYVVNGKSRCHTRLKLTKPSEGGLVQTSVAINQATGRVFVTNRLGAHKVTVIRDGKVPCRRRR